eukprot:6176987-Pleurochrysis_carterae.AAC.2
MRQAVMKRMTRMAVSARRETTASRVRSAYSCARVKRPKYRTPSRVMLAKVALLSFMAVGTSLDTSPAGAAASHSSSETDLFTPWHQMVALV